MIISYEGIENNNSTPDLSVLEDGYSIFSERTSHRTTFLQGHKLHQSIWRIRLLPKTEGKQTIPAINVGQYTTLPVDINVLSAGSQPKLKKPQHKADKSDDSLNMFEMFGVEFEQDLQASKVVQPDGLKKVYYTSGALESEENYKDGKKDGITKWYYESGVLQAEANFIAGKQDGITKWYYETGVLQAEGNFKAGKPDGIAKGYYETGKLKAEQYYKDGQPVKKEKVVKENETQISYYEIPEIEQKFIDINHKYLDASVFTENDIKLRLLYKNRAKEFADMGFDGKVTGWGAEVESVKDSAVSDSVIITMLISYTVKLVIITDMDDPLIEDLAALEPGDVVVISGNLLTDKKTFFKVRSLTVDDGLIKQEYLFKLTSIKKLQNTHLSKDMPNSVALGAFFGLLGALSER